VRRSTRVFSHTCTKYLVVCMYAFGKAQNQAPRCQQINTVPKVYVRGIHSQNSTLFYSFHECFVLIQSFTSPRTRLAWSCFCIFVFSGVVLMVFPAQMCLSDVEHRTVRAIERLAAVMGTDGVSILCFVPFHLFYNNIIIMVCPLFPAVCLKKDSRPPFALH
jgi:hypothetical protein